MKKLNKFVLKSLALLFAFSIAVSCGESKSNQKVLFDKIVSKAGKTVSEIDKTASEIDKAVSEANQSSSKTSGTSVAEGNYDGLEIPVYTKGTLSETIRKRYSYTVSYNHEMKNPNWVAWTISAEHASGKVQRMAFQDDEDMPGTLSETIRKRYSYTVSYNHEMKNPNWVAWTISAEHASGKVQRMAFQDDEDMPGPKGYLSDYYNSGYDRGHMCPAADNKWSEKAMEDCFLITNMCPQDNGLNRGMWNSIEQQCRSWAVKYGKVYVVCGPIYLNQQHRKIGKNKVVVPEAFFKVVLRMGDYPQAIGFICRNQSQKGRKKTDFVNSIDEVERITGYDFFSKLPDNIENKVEAKADINEW